MKKFVFLALVAAAAVAFVGVDVVRATVGRARTAIRDRLTADVPLKAQLAEARAQVDAYAESVIRGEVAAENLEEMIGQVEREVASLTARVGRERLALVSVRRDLEVVPTSTAGQEDVQREALRRARTFQSLTALLERREKDLERLKGEHAATQASIAQAKDAQQHLVQEIQVIAAEIESLEARQSAARTREAVGDATVASSGYAQASERLQAIRAQIKEKDKLLRYYEIQRDTALVSGGDLAVDATPANAIEAVDAALAGAPVR